MRAGPDEGSACGGIIAAMKSWHRYSIIAGGLCLAAAQAADKPGVKPREGSLGNAKSDAPILTREQLRGCLEQQETLRTEGSQVLERQRSFDEEKADVGRARSELNEALATLDRSSQPAVDAYNVRAQELDARIDAYNAKSAPFNARAQALNEQRQGFERDCATRRYREDDLILIKARK